MSDGSGTISIQAERLQISRKQNESIGPLQDPVTWYGINYTGTQITQWDFQKKGKSGWTGTSSSVLEVPLRNLRPSVIYSVPCDRILQRAYLKSFFKSPGHFNTQQALTGAIQS